MNDAAMLRDIAAEIDRYNHMKAAKWLNGLADRMEGKALVDWDTLDQMNLALGLLIGTMTKHGIGLPSPVVAYMKTRGYDFSPYADDGDKD